MCSFCRTKIFLLFILLQMSVFNPNYINFLFHPVSPPVYSFHSLTFSPSVLPSRLSLPHLITISLSLSIYLLTPSFFVLLPSLDLIILRCALPLCRPVLRRNGPVGPGGGSQYIPGRRSLPFRGRGDLYRRSG